jgi:hypothetical protein
MYIARECGKKGQCALKKKETFGVHQTETHWASPQKNRTVPEGTFKNVDGKASSVVVTVYKGTSADINVDFSVASASIVFLSTRVESPTRFEALDDHYTSSRNRFCHSRPSLLGRLKNLFLDLYETLVIVKKPVRFVAVALIPRADADTRKSGHPSLEVL